ncbi:odorant receptor 42b-like [Rhagoletis pomonella]|uniref:odorant receptor 42b-like n=1 Tax=Rhagoletis pomonella TaxID=28610 RepID=UPI00177DEF73|nr:odorant receptor 42b-like [Rhagoletis pomonella]
MDKLDARCCPDEEIEELRKGRVPYNAVLNWRHSNLEFIIVGFWEYFLMSGLSALEALTDGYAPINICIIRAHMKILLIRIQNLGADPECTLAQNYDELKMCIRDHKLLLNLSTSWCQSFQLLPFCNS